MQLRHLKYIKISSTGYTNVILSLRCLNFRLVLLPKRPFKHIKKVEISPTSCFFFIFLSYKINVLGLGLGASVLETFNRLFIKTPSIEQIKIIYTYLVKLSKYYFVY